MWGGWNFSDPRGVRRSGARLRIRSAPSVSKRLKPTTALRAPRSGRSSPPYTACPGGRSREDEERGVGGRPEVLLVLRYTDAWFFVLLYSSALRFHFRFFIFIFAS
ncbi:hypothetical protein B0H19DRAFT_1383370, partial [Mycena capillaripes]